MLDRVVCVGEGVSGSIRTAEQWRYANQFRMCLARGRCYTIPITPILRGCDQWHLSNIADTMDGHLVSMAVLRRDLVGLQAARRREVLTWHRMNCSPQYGRCAMSLGTAGRTAPWLHGRSK